MISVLYLVLFNKEFSIGLNFYIVIKNATFCRIMTADV